MSKQRIPLQEAFDVADFVLKALSPHCERIQIAGSIRRQKAEVGDIEVVITPKPYDTGLFASGIATVINQWEKVKGELPCKYTQRILPGGYKLDVFFAVPDNWGLILAIRTGSAKFSHEVLARGWVRKGYISVGGFLTANGKIVPVREEADLFRLLGLNYVLPQNRH